MRIQVGNKLVNIRKTLGKLWYPKKDKEVHAKMDELFERTNPRELMWDASKPKQKDSKDINPRELVEPEAKAAETKPLTFE